MAIHNRTCEDCKKPFIAEADWSEEEQEWVSCPICFECDALIHRKVDAILKQRYPDTDIGPQWYNE